MTISIPPGGSLGSIAVVADDFFVVAVEFEDADPSLVAAALPPLVAAAEPEPEPEPELESVGVGFSVIVPEVETFVDSVSCAVSVADVDTALDSRNMSVLARHGRYEGLTA